MQISWRALFPSRFPRDLSADLPGTSVEETPF